MNVNALVGWSEMIWLNRGVLAARAGTSERGQLTSLPIKMSLFLVGPAFYLVTERKHALHLHTFAPQQFWLHLNCQISIQWVLWSCRLRHLTCNTTALHQTEKVGFSTGRCGTTTGSCSVHRLRVNIRFVVLISLFVKVTNFFHQRRLKTAGSVVCWSI